MEIHLNHIQIKLINSLIYFNSLSLIYIPSDSQKKNIYIYIYIPAKKKKKKQKKQKKNKKKYTLSVLMDDCYILPK